ncbi:MAG: YkgJ family cysteine cluster protein [Cyclobacteriaceae bacterium]|nr:YkgJ family cysteine cluster protein [Cyclobacteriaceae bacterium]
MNIEQLVHDVEDVYLKLDEEIATFKKRSGLGCKSGCGKCCLKPDIEATALEFIPFAYQLYKQGKAIAWLENPLLGNSLCAILDSNMSGVGHCTAYQYRGMICRLFGFSAKLNKYGHKELITCRVIKTEQPETFIAAYAETVAGANVPLMRDYYMKMYAIDWELSQKFYPINDAIKKAIETVLHYYAYREEEGLAAAE